MSDADLAEILGNNFLFSSLPEKFLTELESSVEMITYKLGETILKKGDPGQGFFIVYKGKVRVVDDSVEGKPVTLAFLTAGQGFGERSLFFDQPVSATIRSVKIRSLKNLH